MYCFFVLSQIIAFDELKTDYKNPIDQCASLNPVSSGLFVFLCLFWTVYIVLFFVFVQWYLVVIIMFMDTWRQMRK